MAHLGLGRDDLLRLIFENDFFDQNPGLESQKEEVQACRGAYTESAAKSSCRCGGNPSLTFECMDNLLARLTALQQENPETVQSFVAYVGRKRNKELGSITIYYRKTAAIPLQKFRFP